MRATTILLGVWQIMVLASTLLGGEAEEQFRIRISWGHRSAQAVPFHIRPVAVGAQLLEVAGRGLEAEDQAKDGAFETTAGAGDVDGVEFTLRYPARQVEQIKDLNVIWADLIAQSDPDTARRLRLDPAYRKDSRRVTIQMDREGTRGFTLTVDQLLQSKVFWIPSLDVYVAAGDPPLAFDEHQKQLQAMGGKRVLDQVHAEPEASYEQYVGRWEDMGSPAYRHPSQPAPGHIVCITWDSACHKFGIDCGAGAWSDLGNPDRFRFWFDFGDLSRGLTRTWKGQKLVDGLPVITTVLEKDDIRYEVEQFVYPLHGPPAERRGDIPMVLMQKVRLTDLSGKARTTAVRIHHERVLPASAQLQVTSPQGAIHLCEVAVSRDLLFSLQGEGAKVEPIRVVARRKVDEKNPNGPDHCTAELTAVLELPRNGSRELIVKLPSPVVRSQDRSVLMELDYSVARTATLKFWSDYLARGAQFQVPEEAVNELFRTNLWHALRLPRRHGGQRPDVRIDLPYSNFAYGQDGTPWPINQAVYVDYMLYDLRGYHDLSVEELLAMYRNNQEKSGHIGGYANWVVYTPSMMYVVARNYLLSRDRAALEKLLPPTLKAMDWCLAEVKRSQAGAGSSSGLVRGPLNDLTGDGVWAFSQAYIYAGLEALGQVLQQIDHPRAAECLDAAWSFRQAVQRGFGAATMNSPLVQLRDHTWIPYVPCEVMLPGRRLDQWYPADVDSGAMHLPRLKALAPDGAMAEFLLHDHEDNLYLKGWGMANEPVYNPQATVYLDRDDVKAVIRAFYSYMACAFSHSVFEPVEHRWTWGQYFGPPSTDGAWFELYRNMLIREVEHDTLFLLQATPRKWLEEGKTIDVRRAPTYYGPLSMTIRSQAAAGRISAEVDMPRRSRPNVLLVRLRHPESKAIRGVTVNGQDWADYDVKKEWIRINQPRGGKYSIVARY